MLAPFPHADVIPRDAEADVEMAWVRDFILGVRQIRGEMDIAPSRKIDVMLQNASPSDVRYMAANLEFLARLAGVNPPQVLSPGEAAPISAVALLGTLEILVPMAGLIDPAAELDRLEKRRRKSEGDVDKLAAKLTNGEFAKNAPAEIIAKDERRLSELRTEIRQLDAQIARVGALLKR